MIRHALVVLFLVTGLIGCGPARPAPRTAVDLMTLSEARALELVAEVLAEAAVARGPAWTVRVTPQTELEVDIRLARSNFGIEWMSPQDRVDLGDAIPRPASGGQLRIVPGIGEQASAQIFVLEASTYRYTNEREVVQRGAPSAHETEGRLRRDVRDFLEYVRGQGGL